MPGAEPTPRWAISHLERTRRQEVKNHALALGLAAALLAITVCNKHDGNAKGPEAAQTPKAQKAAGSKTIAAGLAPTSRFMTIAKAAGLDQSLAGPGPYTVFI